MTAYLLIENPGICPSEGFTILGATTKKDSKNAKTIGMFGSGNKHSVATLLRNEISPIIFTDNLRLEFTTQNIEMSSDLATTEFKQVVVEYSGSKEGREKLGFVLDYGSRDWTTTDMALREFVSNAIDHTIIYNEKHNPGISPPWDGVRVEIVNESEISAKSGFTRIFIPVNMYVEQFFEDLGKWFLHFSEPESLNKTILPKNRIRRNIKTDCSAVIYRRGVRVREFENDTIPSLFDYNIQDLELDESRNADDWVCRMQCTRMIRDGSVKELSLLLLSFLHCNVKWEHKFDTYGLKKEYNDKLVVLEQRKKNWEHALLSVDKTAVFSKAHCSNFVKEKGHIPVILPDTWVSVLTDMGLRTSDTFLGKDEQEGRIIVEPTEDVVLLTKEIWQKIVGFNMHSNKDLPEIHCFHQNVTGSAVLFGYQRDNGIYMNCDISTGTCVDLYVTILEELCHYITNAHDGSRDFQIWMVKFGVKAGFGVS
jgi:hypothetical protein